MTHNSHSPARDSAEGGGSGGGSLGGGGGGGGVLLATFDSTNPLPTGTYNIKVGKVVIEFNLMQEEEQD
jgi:hypothetical protein